MRIIEKLVKIGLNEVCDICHKNSTVKVEHDAS